jgi:hypothetical protein
MSSRFGRTNRNADFTSLTRPSVPSATSALTAAVCGWCRYMNASISTRLVASARSYASSTSSGRREYGFSQRTCLPASSAASVHSW